MNSKLLSMLIIFLKYKIYLHKMKYIFCLQLKKNKVHELILVIETII